MSEAACRVIASALKEQADLAELSISLRRLRRALRLCATCPDKHCPLMQELSTAITNALMELSEEWNL
jgi:hypothetical protein